MTSTIPTVEQLGRAAWGGTRDTLPPGLRIAALITGAVYAGAAVVLLRRAGYAVAGISSAMARRGTWVLAVVFALSALANAVSQSDWERWLMAPIALTLALLSVRVGRRNR